MTVALTADIKGRRVTRHKTWQLASIILWSYLSQTFLFLLFSFQTSLCMRYSQEQFTKQYGQTVGLDFYLKRINLQGKFTNKYFLMKSYHYSLSYPSSQYKPPKMTPTLFKPWPTLSYYSMPVHYCVSLSQNTSRSSSWFSPYLLPCEFLTSTFLLLQFLDFSRKMPLSLH